MVTSLFMMRRKLITKEKMMDYCTGKEYLTDSINDDLESMFEDFRLGNTPSRWDDTYFLPKLTEEELKLTERKDRSYFRTFIEDPEPIVSGNQVLYWEEKGVPIQQNIDVEEAEMKASESNSEYALVSCDRETYTIENSSSLNCSHSCSLQ